MWTNTINYQYQIINDGLLRMNWISGIRISINVINYYHQIINDKLTKMNEMDGIWI